VLIDLVRQNLRLLAELVQPYEVGRQDTVADRTVIR